MSMLRWSVSVALGAALLGSGAQAQDPYRSGFWVESTTGTGAARVACSGCEDVSVAYGSASYLRIGGTASSRVSLGVEVFAHHSAEAVLSPGVPAVDAENAMIAPIVLWYVGGNGFFLKGGAGLARGTFVVSPPSGEPTTTQRTGSGLTFGIGFDIGLLRRLALTANLGTYIMAIGDVQVDATVVDDVIATVYHAGVGITLR